MFLEDKLTQSCNPFEFPFLQAFQGWMIPLPAVIHCTIKYMKRRGISFVGAKAQNHIMGLGPHTERLAMSEERKWMPKGLPAQLSWIGRHLKDGLRRNASSDVMSMAQTCTLSIRRTYPNGH